MEQTFPAEEISEPKTNPETIIPEDNSTEIPALENEPTTQNDKSVQLYIVLEETTIKK